MTQPTITIDDIAKVSIQLLIKEPFYGHYLNGVPKEISQRVGTAAVALQRKDLIKLIINPDFWRSLTPQTQYGLIKHEILHIVFKHLLRADKFNNKHLFNIAADLVVNQYIAAEQLPAGGITLAFFAPYVTYLQIELLPEQTVDYYYQQLSKLQQQAHQCTGNHVENNDANSGDCQESSNNSNKNNQQNNDKKSGTGANEPDWQQLSDVLSGEHRDLERHKFWKEFREMTAAEQKILEEIVNANLKQAVKRVEASGKYRGFLPAGLLQKLDMLLAEMQPKFNWKRVLRLFAASSSSTYLKNTLRRPSKRYGTTPGIKVKRRHRLLVAIDTSGSVQIDELRQFFNEIYYIWRQGAEVYVVECDVAIHNHYRYTGTPPENISGRGGTSFNAPVHFGNEEYHPDALIYFTDGHAPAPQFTPRYPVLWVISSNGINAAGWDFLPGQKLKIE